MGKPITTATGGICFAFPDVCFTPPTTPASPSGIPIPYPNIGQLSDIEDSSNNVNAAGTAVVHVDSTIADQKTTGDEAGSLGGVTSGGTKGAVAFTSSSTTVKVNGKGVVRMFDSTTQNNENAVGIVLGGAATVLVGD